MLAESSIRARYLSLALDVRKVIDALVMYVKESDTPNLLEIEQIVRKVVSSLNSATDKERIFSSADRRSLFGDYERIQTLEEVKHDFPAQNLDDQLASLLRNDIDTKTRKHNAEQAIQFFCALEGRALERYAQTMDM